MVDSGREPAQSSTLTPQMKAALESMLKQQAQEQVVSNLPAIGPYALPALAGIFSAQQGVAGYQQGEQKSLGSGLFQQAKNPISWQVPSRFLGSALGSTFGSSKGEDQTKRDALRQLMQSRGMLGQDYTLGLADGSRFDIGVDGGKRLANGARPYDVDFSQKTAGQDVGYIQALADIISQGDRKGASDLTGYFVNAARSGGDALKNFAGFYKQAGLNHQTALDRITSLEKAGRIDKERADAERGGIMQLLSALSGPQPQPTPAPTPVYRSTTRSPGILKDGTRISYGR